MPDSDQAVLLRRIRLTDTSLVVVWLTAGSGRLKTVAKGARRPRSPFAGRLDLFFSAEISFARSRRSELHALREVAVRDPREGVRRDYLRTRLASYFVELVELTTEPEQPVAEIYDLLVRALDYLARAETVPTGRALRHFEAELSRALGLTGPRNPAADPASAVAALAGNLPRDRGSLLRDLARTTPPGDGGRP